MSSRAPKAPRIWPTKTKKRSPVMAARDFPDLDRTGHRKAVCKKCGLVMPDCEPGAWSGEFNHVAKPHQTRAKKCSNEGRVFDTSSREIEPFMPKRRRRALKRLGVRA